MKNCLILGSGRSGTSMVAGSLRNAGYNMGAGLKEGTPSNPLGYFESAEINDLNEALLAPVAAGLAGRPVTAWKLPHPPLGTDQHWLACLPPEAGVPSVPNLESSLAAAAARTPFCYKDPRFSYTLPVWRPHLAGPEAVYVCVFRQPGRTVNSILKDCGERDYLRGLPLPPAYLWQVWIQMYDRVVRVHRRRGKWLFLHYDQVAAGGGLRRLARFLEAPVDAGFPTPALNRSRDRGNVPRQARVLYWKMKMLSWLPT
ncbi:MAG: hypothetical protein R6X19_02755 [Kiritimatiellia bacterium]